MLRSHEVIVIDRQHLPAVTSLLTKLRQEAFGALAELGDGWDEVEPGRFVQYDTEGGEAVFGAFEETAPGCDYLLAADGKLAGVLAQAGIPFALGHAVRPADLAENPYALSDDAFWVLDGTRAVKVIPS